MTSRRRSSNKNLGNSISDVRRRIRYLERKPIRTKIQNRVIKASAIAPSSITADEVDFGTTVITNENPADVIDNPKEGLGVINPDNGEFLLFSSDQNDYIPVADATARTTADGKNTIYAQTTAPSGASLKTNDIWYDTDDGNKLYVWNGTSWANIQDTAIATAAAAATAAQSTADGKNKVYRQSSTPTGTFAIGDLWFDTANGDRISRWSGTAWVQYGLGYQAISSIDAGTISVGTLNAARIAANSLDVSVLQAGTLRSGTIYTGNIVASQITTGTITAAVEMTSATITGALIRQAASGTRIEMNAASPGKISFYSAASTYPGILEVKTETTTSSDGTPNGTVTSNSGTVVLNAPYDVSPISTIKMVDSGSAGIVQISTSYITLAAAGAGILSTGTLGFQYINDVSPLIANLKNIASSTVLPSASGYYNGTVFLVYT